VRRAPAFWARGTLDEQHDGLLHKSGTKAGREKGDPRAGYRRFIGGARHHAGSKG
jgi:hypothetical protein